MKLGRRAALAASLLAIPALARAQAQAPRDQVTLLLDWFVNPDHAPIIVARNARLPARR